MSTDTKQMRKLASAATQGPWKWWTSCSYRRLTSEGAGNQDGNVMHAYVNRHDNHPDISISQEDMAFTEAVHPGAVLEMLDELDALRQKVIDLERAAGAPRTDTGCSKCNKYGESQCICTVAKEPVAPTLGAVTDVANNFYTPSEEHNGFDFDYVGYAMAVLTRGFSGPIVKPFAYARRWYVERRWADKGFPDPAKDWPGQARHIAITPTKVLDDDVPLYLFTGAGVESRPGTGVQLTAAELFDVFEAGWSFKTSLSGSVFDARDVNRIADAEFWPPVLQGLTEGLELHNGKSVSEGVVALKMAIMKRFEDVVADPTKLAAVKEVRND